MKVGTVGNRLMFLGETAGFWVQTIIFSLSALFAFWAIIRNERINKSRATIDLIINEQKDEVFTKSFKRVQIMVDSKQRLIDLPNEIETEHSQKDADFSDVQIVLNRLEFIAQGIRQGVFEEQIFKDLKHTSIMRLWREVKPLIEEIRRKKGVPTYYQELEWLTDRWEKNPIKKLK